MGFFDYLLFGALINSLRNSGRSNNTHSSFSTDIMKMATMTAVWIMMTTATMTIVVVVTTKTTVLRIVVMIVSVIFKKEVRYA